MNKKIIIIPIFVIVIISGLFIIKFSEKESDVTTGLFFLSMTNSDYYSDGIYMIQEYTEEGEYSFRFTPSGSSPKILSITLSGENFDFHEDFKLKSIAHDAWNGEKYYTWEYVGKKTILISEEQEVTITVDPNGSVNGEYSVGLMKNK